MNHFRFLVLWMTTATTAGAQGVTPPTQPAEGPGGAQHAHAAVAKHRYGSGNDEYWLYEPDAPRPNRAPVVVFLHGFSAMNPATYGAWIDHIVKRGNIVVYPRYQADLRAPLDQFTGATVRAVRDALRRLQTEAGHVLPDTAKFATVGHSVGGLLTANLAAVAADSGLPRMLAVMSVEPARTWNPLPRMNVPLMDMNRMPRETLLLVVAGEADLVARDVDAKRIFTETARIPSADKNLVTLVSDDHGLPRLVAGHGAPTALDPAYDNGERPARGSPGRGPVGARVRGRIAGRRDAGVSDSSSAATPPDVEALAERSTNALDYFGMWKLFDALSDAAFFGTHREYALGNTPQQRFMGHWSDGTPVKELRVSANVR